MIIIAINNNTILLQIPSRKSRASTVAWRGDEQCVLQFPLNPGEETKQKVNQKTTNIKTTITPILIMLKRTTNSTNQFPLNPGEEADDDPQGRGVTALASSAGHPCVCMCICIYIYIYIHTNDTYIYIYTYNIYIYIYR